MDGTIRTVLVVTSLATAVLNVLPLELEQDCINPDGQPGKCILFRQCQPLVNIFLKPINTPDEEKFLMDSRCGQHNRKTLVCCAGTTDPAKTLPEPPKCGIQLSDRIYGGQNTAIKEFPWTALIEYQKPGGQFGFHCGGAIINERYIVTAAHCVTGIPKTWEVHRVRLGEWDLSTSIDREGEFEADPPIDLGIDKIIVHSGYNESHVNYINDIALIRVDRAIKYSQTIQPVCLAITDENRNRSHVGLAAYAVGWGQTEGNLSRSNIKMKVEVSIKDHEECASTYAKIGISLQSSHMCAGGVRGKATCFGDSGGPLMRQLGGAWYMIGIVSFGVQKCGTEGYPGVYTNVAEYIDWIQQSIS